MYSLSQITHIHLEISSLCNASCAWCPRNFWGYTHNDGYPEVNLTLENVQHILTPEMVAQLKEIYINGNFGDIVMNPEAPDIIEYLREHNSDLRICISTNGGARNRDFWERLAKAGAIILFALDGLDDTHHLYRQNTRWQTVIKNAEIFIAAGGHAIWKMIKFDHNQHQVAECQRLSYKMGFLRFSLTDNNLRNTGPVFDQKGKLTHCLGNYQGEKNFEILFHKKRNDTIVLSDIIKEYSPAEITCKVKNEKSVYICANGEIYPCCYLGLYPKTYGHGQYHQAANAQFKDLIRNNNALEYSLEECIQWFGEIEKTWKIPTFEAGRLVICNSECGAR